MGMLDLCTCCILCANILIVLSVPLGKTTTQQPKSSGPKSKYFIPGGKNSLSILKNKVSKSSEKFTAKQAEPDFEDTSFDYSMSTEDGIDGSGGFDSLTSITDTILQQDKFSANTTSFNISSLDLELPVPRLLVPQTGESNSPANQQMVYKAMHERAQYLRLTEVKESILSKLRLLAPPNMTASKINNKVRTYPDHIMPKIPDEQLDLQQDQADAREDNYYAKIDTILQFATAFPEEKEPELYPTESIAYFSLPLLVSQKNVEKATLLVYIATPDQQSGNSIQLTISDTQYINKPFINRTVTLSPRGHWEHVDVSQLVRTWAADDNNNYGLHITAIFGNTNIAYLHEDPLQAEQEIKHIGKDITSRPHRTPLVRITLNEQPGRYKRSFDEVPLSCEIADNDNRCCRYRFVIDLSSMGEEFNFIIQPRRFLANYCAGTCPTYYLPTDAHSRMMMGRPKPKMQRCCTPVTKKDLSIVYHDGTGGFLSGKLSEMTIEKCQCS